jgi:hypothetical protein
MGRSLRLPARFTGVEDALPLPNADGGTRKALVKNRESPTPGRRLRPLSPAYPLVRVSAGIDSRKR